VTARHVQLPIRTSCAADPRSAAVMIVLFIGYALSLPNWTGPTPTWSDGEQASAVDLSVAGLTALVTSRAKT